VRYNQSDFSESIYLNINLGSKEAPVTLHVRVSNHPASPHTGTKFDYDIYAYKMRQGATTYIKFLMKFATRYGVLLPKELWNKQPGTANYKKYAIAMQYKTV
jgi:hypothetical protein